MNVTIIKMQMFNEIEFNLNGNTRSHKVALVLNFSPFLMFCFCLNLNVYVKWNTNKKNEYKKYKPVSIEKFYYIL